MAMRRNAVAETTRAYRLNGKDLTIRRWTAGAYRYAGDENTAAGIDESSDWPGVQQACQEYAQAMKYEHNAKVIADKKAAFEGQVIAFARAARGDRPEVAQAVRQRVADNVAAGRYNECFATCSSFCPRTRWMKTSWSYRRRRWSASIAMP